MKHFLCIRYIVCLFAIFGVSDSFAQVAAVKFIVNIPRFNSLKDTAVYLTGSFNGWMPKDSLYRMNREDEHNFSLLVPLFEGKNYLYKYTLGGWSTVETAINDSDIANRRLFSRNGYILTDTVSKWKAEVPAFSKNNNNPQMQRLVAIKDSMVSGLKPKLNDLLTLLKQYNENMLSSQPNIHLHKQLDKKTIKLMGQTWGIVSDAMWKAITSLSPEQRQKILAAMSQPSASGDTLNTILNSYKNTLQ